LGIILTVVALGTVALLHFKGKTTLFGVPLSALWYGVVRLFLALVWHTVATRA
jgi:hypothetical protein